VAEAKPSVEIQNRTGTNDCPAGSEAVALVITGQEQDRGSVPRLCVAAGKPSVQLLSDKKGRVYVLLDYAKPSEGSIIDVLEVYRLDGGALFEVFETRLSCSTEKARRGRYVYAAESSRTSGLELKLNAASEVPSAGLDSAHDYPRCDESVAFWIDPLPLSAPLSRIERTMADDWDVRVIHAGVLGGSGTGTTSCGFPDDAAVLVTTDFDDRPIAWTFCSSYGEAKARNFTDESGRRYVLLEYVEGRGTWPAAEHRLVVYCVSRRGLVELLRTRLNWPTGFSSEFTYAYSFGRTLSNGLEIGLIGKTDSDTNTCCVPEEKQRSIWINPEPLQ
jgi:hypothetical protein